MHRRANKVLRLAMLLTTWKVYMRGTRTLRENMVRGMSQNCSRGSTSSIELLKDRELGNGKSFQTQLEEIRHKPQPCPKLADDAAERYVRFVALE